MTPSAARRRVLRPARADPRRLRQCHGRDRERHRWARGRAVATGVSGKSGVPPAQAFYFTIPSNPKLLGYWGTVADRLYKLRHCQSITGAPLQLALFDAPIDPGLLIAAQAAGVDLSSVLLRHQRGAAQLPLHRPLPAGARLRQRGTCLRRLPAGSAREERRGRAVPAAANLQQQLLHRRQPGPRLAGAAGPEQPRRGSTKPFCSHRRNWTSTTPSRSTPPSTRGSPW